MKHINLITLGVGCMLCLANSLFATAIPTTLDLKPGFKPDAEHQAAARYLAFDGSQGCEIGEIDGFVRSTSSSSNRGSYAGKR